MREKPDVRALWNHDSSKVLARSKEAGTLRYVKRSLGVWIEMDPPHSASGYVESIERRDVTGMSFGFRVKSDGWWMENDTPHREILDMSVIEFSAVSFPAIRRLRFRP